MTERRKYPTNNQKNCHWHNRLFNPLQKDYYQRPAKLEQESQKEETYYVPGTVRAPVFQYLVLEKRNCQNCAPYMLCMPSSYSSYLLPNKQSKNCHWHNHYLTLSQKDHNKDRDSRDGHQKDRKLIVLMLLVVFLFVRFSRERRKQKATYS